jgi:4-oxalocrotonate tautomerase family enzyme
MPVVQIYMYSGKSKKQKRISADFEEVTGIKPESLNILFHEIEKENWGSRGNLASERR